MNIIARYTKSMRPIDPKNRKKMAADKFYKQCCLKDEHCHGRIEWHHVWIYAGKQIDEIWAIVPVCYYHHQKAGVGEVKDKLELVSLGRASDEDLKRYNKKNWPQIKNYLKLK